MDNTAERVTTAATPPPVESPTSATVHVFPGESDMARLMREKDWSQTPLGAVEEWPPSLRTVVGICLSSRFPILIWWGSDLVMLYNDAYRLILGAKHPAALGTAGQRVWPEIWHIIGPMLEGVQRDATATWSDDQLLPLERSGYPEECYFTFSYSPIQDESGRVGGVFCAVTETTPRVLAERRARSARDLAAAVVDAHSAEEVCARAVQTLAAATADVPFASLYLLDGEGCYARLAGSVGLSDSSDEALAPRLVELGAEGVAYADGTRGALARAAATNQPKYVSLPSLRWNHPPLLGELPLIPHTALILPIARAGQSAPAAVLVAGVSPMRMLDDAYQGYYDLLASHLSAGFTAAQAYEEERKRAEALAEIDRAKTAFFSNVSHEFRTPLTLMLGPLGDLLAEDAALPQEVRSQVEVIHRNGLRLAKLVNTLLDFSRIEAERAQASYVPTDLAALTADLASAFRSLVERAGLGLVVECPPLGDALPQPVHVDREMWEKIVLNLLSNAFKFTFEGSITVALRAVDDGRAVELEVRDTGTGIPAAELPRLFERFHQVQGARARTHEGSGIGLALVQELVHLHGGTIWVESAEGVGTSVFVRLPVGAAHLPADRVGVRAMLPSTALGAAPFVREAERWLPQGAAARDAVRDALTSPLAEGVSARTPTASAEPRDVAQPARILLADDNADMRDYLRRLLGERYTVEAVANGAESLAAIRREPPDLVLSDMMMPELDGFALLRALRDDPATKALPVILLSARAGEEATVEGLEAGADDYLIKPFAAREVLSRVAARLEIARTRREVEARARELETALEAVADAVFVYDRDGKIVRTNSAARALYGLDALPGYAERSPRQRVELIAVCDEQGRPIPAEELGLYRLLQGEALTGPDAMDMRLRLADGRELEVNIAGAPLRDEKGAITGAIAISRDVTDRKRLERRTRQALDALLRLAAAIVSVPGDRPDVREGAAQGSASPTDEALHRLAALCCQVLASERIAIIAMEPETEQLHPVAITTASPTQEALFRDRLGDRHLADRFGATVAAQLKAGETVLVDVSGLRPDDPAHVLARRYFLIAPMLTASGLTGYIGVNYGDEAHEYTPENRALALAVAQLVGMVMERERLTREREDARLRELALAETNRRMNDFLGIASHELRTPLTSVTANVQMAERALRPRTATAAAVAVHGETARDTESAVRHAHELLERAERQVIRLDRLVGDLLDASRIQAGKLDLRWEICDLCAVVREGVEAQRTAWPKRTIELDLPRGGSIALRADPDRIGQVVANYLTNALKYSAGERPVAVRLRRDRGGVRVEVRDAGPGLSAEQQSHLFERFSRVPGIEQLSGSGVGLGLGLYICKTIVERHGGRLGVESAPGMGSTFWFTLPLPTMRRAR